MSASFLSLVEKGGSDISLGRLLAVLRFYDISLADLLPETRSPEPNVVRASARPRIVFPAEGTEVFLLTPDTKRMFSPTITVYKPHSKPAEYSQHPGQEFFLVLRGRLRFTLEGGGPVMLEEGDSVYYECDRKHMVENLSDSAEAAVLFVSCPPTL